MVLDNNRKRDKMKKRLFACVATIVLLFSTMGTAKAGGFYEGEAPGTSILSARIGLVNVVGANVAYDYALARVWKGTFTIGGQVGYMWDGRSETIGGLKYKWARNKLDFKIRTTYRLNILVPEWEVYAGVGLGGGVSIYHEKAKVKEGGFHTDGRTESTYGFVSGSFILGTSYNFTRNIGVNLEFDFGNLEQAWINLGVQFSF